MNIRISKTGWLALWAVLLWIGLAELCFTRVAGPLASNGDLLAYVSLVFGFVITRATRRDRLSSFLFQMQCMISLLPLAYMLTMAGFVGHVLVRLGRIPYPHQPNPDTIGIGAFMFTTVYLLICGTFLVTYVFLHRSSERLWTNSAIRGVCFICSVMCWLAFLAVKNYDPLHFLDWLWA